MDSSRSKEVKEIHITALESLDLCHDDCPGNAKTSDGVDGFAVRGLLRFSPAFGLYDL